jgi:hypothetical protein
MLDAEDQLLKGLKPSRGFDQLFTEYGKLKEARPVVPEPVADRGTKKIKQQASVRRTLAESRVTEAKLRSATGGSSRAA